MTNDVSFLLDMVSFIVPSWKSRYTPTQSVVWLFIILGGLGIAILLDQYRMQW